nr:RNA-directed DNA polymerase, eukaryota, nucleotide-binding alpha-beta plait domain protein [Tanacetum cinerariifolium]
MANDWQRNFSTNEDLTQKVSHSIFATNFPESVTPRDLWRVCGTYGTVVDVFILVKRSKVRKRFAFVHFIKVTNLDWLVKNLCTLWIGDYHLYANQVRFERPRINQFPSLNGSSRVLENQGLRQPHGSYAKVVNATSPMVNASHFLSSAPALVLDNACIVERDLSKHIMGKVFMVRAKELFTWNPTFLPPKEIVYSLDDDLVQADNENYVHPCDIGEQHLADTFELYGLLNKRKQAEEDVQEEVSCASVGQSFVKTGGSVLGVLEEVIRVGQAMGFSMEGCRWNGDAILMGDFNEVRSREERRGSCFNPYSARVFDNFISSSGLVDIKIKVCLDRHLSDHRPILLHEVHVDFGPTPFRLYHSWFNYDGFDEMVANTWRKVFMVRAKELFTWNPTFLPPKEIVYSLDDDLVQADNENYVHPCDNDVEGGDDNASTDDGVAEKVFVTGDIGEQHLADTFELYGLLNKRKQAEEDVQEEVSCASVGQSFVKTGGSVLGVLEEVIRVGQAMGFSMEGCLGNKTKKGWIRELSVKHKLNFIEIQETKMESVSYIDVKAMWGRWNGDAILMGDFNEVRSREERRGSCFNPYSARVFDNFISSSGLVDIKIKVCLDRHLSDHRPILLHEVHVDFGPTPFRDVDKDLEQGVVSDYLISKRHEVTRQLQDIKSKEAADFIQKSKVRWAIEG